MLDVPTETPYTDPLTEAAVAMAVLPLDHVPPAVRQLKVLVFVTQTDVLPVMGAGEPATVTVTDVRQPVGNV